MARREQQTTKVRPWPVFVLIALSGAGLIWGLVVDGHRNLWDIPLSMFTLWITYLLWTGKRWAFTLSFMLATLCAGLILLIAVVQVFLWEEGLLGSLMWGLLSSAVWIALLMHPETKRFAGASHAPRATEDVAAG
jgi:hypothetical protein